MADANSHPGDPKYDIQDIVTPAAAGTTLRLLSWLLVTSHLLQLFFGFLPQSPNQSLACTLLVAKNYFELPTHEHSKYLFLIFLEHLNFGWFLVLWCCVMLVQAPSKNRLAADRKQRISCSLVTMIDPPFLFSPCRQTVPWVRWSDGCCWVRTPTAPPCFRTWPCEPVPRRHLAADSMGTHRGAYSKDG